MRNETFEEDKFNNVKLTWFDTKGNHVSTALGTFK